MGLLTGDDLAKHARLLPRKVLRGLGNMLHQPCYASGNWETVAENLGYDYEEIKHFSTMASIKQDITPGELMLQHWVQQPCGRTFFVLYNALTKAEREDCIQYLEKEIYDCVICTDLMICIKYEDGRSASHICLKTRADCCLLESLCNLSVLEQPIQEKYTLLDTNVSWNRSLAKEFKGRQLMLLKKLDDMEQNPTVDSSGIAMDATDYLPESQGHCTGVKVGTGVTEHTNRCIPNIVTQSRPQPVLSDPQQIQSCQISSINQASGINSVVLSSESIMRHRYVSGTQHMNVSNTQNTVEVGTSLYINTGTKVKQVYGTSSCTDHKSREIRNPLASGSSVRDSPKGEKFNQNNLNSRTPSKRKSNAPHSFNVTDPSCNLVENNIKHSEDKCKSIDFPFRCDVPACPKMSAKYNDNGSIDSGDNQSLSIEDNRVIHVVVCDNKLDHFSSGIHSVDDLVEHEETYKDPNDYLAPAETRTAFGAEVIGMKEPHGEIRTQTDPEEGSDVDEYKDFDMENFKPTETMFALGDDSITIETVSCHGNDDSYHGNDETYHGNDDSCHKNNDSHHGNNDGYHGNNDVNTFDIDTHGVYIDNDVSGRNGDRVITRDSTNDNIDVPVDENIAEYSVASCVTPCMDSTGETSDTVDTIQFEDSGSNLENSSDYQYSQWSESNHDNNNALEGGSNHGDNADLEGSPDYQYSQWGDHNHGNSNRFAGGGNHGDNADFEGSSDYQYSQWGGVNHGNSDEFAGGHNHGDNDVDEQTAVKEVWPASNESLDSIDKQILMEKVSPLSNKRFPIGHAERSFQGNEKFLPLRVDPVACKYPTNQVTHGEFADNSMKFVDSSLSANFKSFSFDSLKSSSERQEIPENVCTTDISGGREVLRTEDCTGSSVVRKETRFYLDLNAFSQISPDSSLSDSSHDVLDHAATCNNRPGKKLNRFMSQYPEETKKKSVYERLHRGQSCPDELSYGAPINFLETPVIADVFSPITEESKSFEFQDSDKGSNDRLDSIETMDTISGKRHTFPLSMQNQDRKRTRFQTQSQRPPDKNVRFNDDGQDSSIERSLSPALPPRKNLPDIRKSSFQSESLNPGINRGRSVNNGEQVPCKRVTAGKSSRPSLDSLLANDKLYEFYNTQLHGYPGWCPKESEHTIEKTMRDALSSDGYFILWYIRERKSLVLSVSFQHKLINYRIHTKVFDNRMNFYICQGHYFQSVHELLKYYRDFGVRIDISSLQGYFGGQGNRISLTCPVSVQYGRNFPVSV